MRLRDAWQLGRRSVAAFFEDDAFSKGAAISFYAVLALGPTLLIIVAVVGFLYGDAAARGALLGRLSHVMGQRAAGFLQNAIKGAGSHGAGVTATIVGVISLLLTATGVFGEMQSALNAIWRAQPKGSSVRQLLRTRIVSLGLVLLLAVVLVVSLVLSTLIAGLQHNLNSVIAVPAALVGLLNFVLSFVLLSALIAAVYKVLPDRDLDWRDVAAGAVVTALLITIGKVAIGIYIGSSATISGYGAAGSMIAVLFWIYYSVEIFLLGAEFTRVYAEREDSFRRSPAESGPPSDPGSAGSDRLSRTAG